MTHLLPLSDYNQPGQNDLGNSAVFNHMTIFILLFTDTKAFKSWKSI